MNRQTQQPGDEETGRPARLNPRRTTGHYQMITLTHHGPYAQPSTDDSGSRRRSAAAAGVVTTAVAGLVAAAVPRAVATAVVRTAAPRTAVAGGVTMSVTMPMAVTMTVAMPVSVPVPVTSQSNIQVEVVLEHSNLLTCEDFPITLGSIEIHCQKSLGNPPIARGGIRIREVRDFQRGESNHRAVESSTAVPTIRTSIDQRH